MIKVGQRDKFGGGRKFVFHNTAIQPKGAFHVFSGHVNPNTVTRNNIFDCPTAIQPKGAFHVFSGHVNPNTVTRNNIFDCPGRLTSSRPVETDCDFDYDLFTGMDRGIAKERHGIRGKPSFIKSYSLEFYPSSTTTKIKWGKVAKFQSNKEIRTSP
ncbi:MAG: hypothetical protein ACYSYL_20690 [Planctomycetota bacterium]|jgi:hypothetical protein